jgi:hypothetical protein
LIPIDEDSDMTRFAMLGAAVVSAVILAAPAMAQEEGYIPGYCTQLYPNADCRTKGPGNPSIDDYRQHMAHQQDLEYRDRAWERGWRHSWDDER